MVARYSDFLARGRRQDKGGVDPGTPFCSEVDAPRLRVAPPSRIQFLCVCKQSLLGLVIYICIHACAHILIARVRQYLL
jgi:hypothetical protein